MKKLLILTVLAFLLKALPGIAGPVFNVNKVEILCSKTNFRDTRKIVHVMSNAGWSVFQFTGLKITDAGNVTIATYTNITGDFYAPPLPLVSGQTYTIVFLNGDGTVVNPSPPHNPSPYIRIAPGCSIDVRQLQQAPAINKANLMNRIE